MKTLFTFVIVISALGISIAQTSVSSVNSGNWSSPSTWNTQTVPAPNDNVTISAGTTVKIDSASFCSNIIISSNSTLNGDTLSSLHVAGNWSNSGTYNHGKAAVIFNGTTAQQIGGTASSTFYSLEINNSAGVALSGNLQVKYSLTISNGTLTVGGYKLTLLSDSVSTAFLAPLNTGSDIDGKISVQRYLSSSTTGWRFLGSPVRTTLQDWSNDFITSGFPGSTYPWFNFCSIYSYNETDTGSCVNGYEIPAGVTDSILPGVGYWCWVGPTPTTVEVSGYPNKFNQNFNVSLTPSGGKYEDGWCMIANPYPSAIDWDSPSWTKTGIQDAIYIWDPETEQYTTYINGTGINGGENIIPSGRAFWVQANQNNPVLSCTEMVKTSSDATFLRPANSPQLRLNFSGNSYNDETVILFSDNSSKHVNSSEDAIKLYSDNPLVPSINSVTDTTDLAVNSLPIHSVTAIPVKVKVGVSGTYTLSMAQGYQFNTTACIFLEDLVTGSLINMRNSFSYTFNINDTTSSPRFLLHITKPLQKASINTSCSYKQNGMGIANVNIPGAWSYTWKDMLGNVLTVHQGVTSADTLKNLAPGIYFVTAQSNNSFCSSLDDQLYVIAPDTIAAKIKVQDNACLKGHNGQLGVQGVTGGTAPFSYKWSNGQAGNTAQNLFPGVYTLVVTDSKGCTDTSFHAIHTTSILKSSFQTDNDTASVFVNDPVVFSNQSVGALTYNWNFGDTTFSTSTNPVHFYTSPGTQTVVLTAYDDLCTSSFQKLVNVKAKAQPTVYGSLGNNETITISNVGNDALVTFDLLQPDTSMISVFSADGKLLLSQNVPAYKNTESIYLGDSHGMYVVRVSASGNEASRKFIK